MIHIEEFTFNAFQTRCCVLWDDAGFCAFIDPGCASEAELAQLTGLVSARSLKPVCIMLTHAHFDHIYGMSALAKRYRIPVYAHSEEIFTIENTNPYVCKCYGLPLPELFPMAILPEEADLQGRFICVSEGDTIEVGSLRFSVLETPGHSRGGLCFHEATEGVLFSGDTLFAGAIGRTDHPGGDYDLLIKSIFEKLLPLDESQTAARHTSIKVIPGHGPWSDLATEGMTNPFLLPFNEPYED